MRIKAIKTRLIKLPKDDLFEAISSSIKALPESSILAIASKVVSVHQGRCVLKKLILHKVELIR
jgi:F420-0:gamma-glutamyl ligase